MATAELPPGPPARREPPARPETGAAGTTGAGTTARPNPGAAGWTGNDGTQRSRDAASGMTTCRSAEATNVTMIAAPSRRSSNSGAVVAWRGRVLLMIAAQLNQACGGHGIAVEQFLLTNAMASRFAAISYGGSYVDRHAPTARRGGGHRAGFVTRRLPSVTPVFRRDHRPLCHRIR